MSVVSGKGEKMGVVSDFIIDKKTGKLIAFNLKPSRSQIAKKLPKNKDGTISLPSQIIESLKTTIVMNEKKLKILLLKKRLKS